MLGLVIQEEILSKLLDCYCLVCKGRHAFIDCTTFDREMERYRKKLSL